MTKSRTIVLTGRYHPDSKTMRTLVAGASALADQIEGESA